LLGLENPFTQNGVTDVADVDEIVVSRSDIEVDIDAAVDWPSLIDNLDSAATWWQRRPANIIATGSP
jgi:hypothetical protein